MSGARRPKRRGDPSAWVSRSMSNLGSRGKVAGSLLLATAAVGALHFGRVLRDPRDQSQRQKEVTVVLRYDDYSALSSTELERQMIQALRERGIPCTFGVIPYRVAGSTRDPSPQEVVPLTSEKGKILEAAAKEGIVEVALHGYSHQVISTEDLSEFRGLPIGSQVARIEDGRVFLERVVGAPISVFIPPFNTYDTNTILALEGLGFQSIAASMSGSGDSTRLKFVPETCRISELRQAVESARRATDRAPVVVATFHPYDFLEVDNVQGATTYQGFRELLDWLASQKDVRLASFRDVLESPVDLSGRRLSSNAAAAALLKLLPPVARPSAPGPTGFYLSSALGQEVSLVRLAYVAAFYCAVIALAVAVTMGLAVLVRLRLRRPTLQLLAMYLSLIALPVCVGYCFRNGIPTYKGMLAMSAVAGICVGVWRSARRDVRGSLGRRATSGTAVVVGCDLPPAS